MKVDAVFEGGGVKGIALAGAVTAIEEEGYEWNNLAGTSAGAIAAALLAVGYSGQELRSILTNLDYKRLLDRKGRILGPFKVFKLIRNKGIYGGSELEAWISKLLEAKGKTKFKDIAVQGKSRLKIIAADITQRKMLILPEDIAAYGIDPMELTIATAVRMSIAIPFFFQPVIFKSGKTENIVVDGGVLSNFPIWIYDTDAVPHWPTFGLKLYENEKSFTSKGKKNIISYLLDIAETMLQRNEEVYLDDKDRVRTINIPTLGIKTTQFNITLEQCNNLYNSGYRAAKNFMKSWDFQQYIKKYRIGYRKNKVCG